MNLKKQQLKYGKTYDNTHGYVTGELKTVDSFDNYEDNVMICYRMFDSSNQRLMRADLSEEALEYINNNL